MNKKIIICQMLNIKIFILRFPEKLHLTVLLNYNYINIIKL